MVASLLRAAGLGSEQSKTSSISENTVERVELPISSQGIPTMYDLVMGSLHGGKNRTIDEWKELLEEGGFKLVKVWPLRASTGQAVLEATIV